MSTEETPIKPTPRPADKLRTALEACRGEKHVIIIRGYPDPDSIGSAMAHAVICQQFHVEATVLYFDDISHQENRALVKKLAVDMVRYQEGMDLSGYARMSIVDAQRIEFPISTTPPPILSIVDHHKLQGDLHAQVIDVREDAGSTCAIYSEYLEAGLGALEPDTPVADKLASALLYGIRSDTDDYLLARGIDYKAAAFLAPFADHDLLMSISMQSISPRTMEVTQKAYANKVIADTYLIAGVGYVRDEDRDSIGQAADYLLRREGIDTAICYGIVNNQFVDGSMRTTSNVVDPDRFIKELFGNDAHGVPYGGGRSDKGAFKIHLGPFASCSDRELLWRMARRTIEDLFFNKVGINHD